MLTRWDRIRRQPERDQQLDINAQHGHPSRGLLQVIGSTFARSCRRDQQQHLRPIRQHRRRDQLRRPAYGPNLANQYGGIGSGHGYALGTLCAAPGWGWVGERGPELMHFRGGEQVIPAYRAGGATTIIVEVDRPLPRGA